MAYHIETTHSSGYRCTCCARTSKDSWWEDSLEEALSALPTTFPTEGDFGGIIGVVVKDGSTGQVIAKSEVSYAPVWQRGDGYKFTDWSLFIDEEAAPGRGTLIHQIIKGTNRVSDDPEPLDLITDRSWSQLCDELQEAHRQKEIRKAEAALVEATKKLAHLSGSAPAPANE